jgi:hypothetical protein
MSISQTIRDNLLAIADAYARETGLSLSTISGQFYGRQQFFREFRTGKYSITDRKLEGVLKAFSAKWPAGLPWPKTAPILMTRPARKKSVN